MTTRIGKVLFNAQTPAVTSSTVNLNPNGSAPAMITGTLVSGDTLAINVVTTVDGVTVTAVATTITGSTQTSFVYTLPSAAQAVSVTKTGTTGAATVIVFG